MWWPNEIRLSKTEKGHQWKIWWDPNEVCGSVNSIVLILLS
jgi:hypothetical protein